MRDLPISVVLALVPAQAPAHDYWLEPLVTAKGATEIHFCVGELLAGEERPLSSDRTVRAELRGAETVADVKPPTGEERFPPALPPEAASGLFIYRSIASSITLDAFHFNAYLAAEGLTPVLAARASRGEDTREGRESYSRAAKLLVGAVDRAAATRAAGLRLEIVPEDDPRALEPGDWLGARVEWEGQPLAGVTVRLLHREPRARQGRIVGEAISGVDGRVWFRLGKPGFYLIKAVHMVPATIAGADWESVWASLTFASERHK